MSLIIAAKVLGEGSGLTDSRAQDGVDPDTVGVLRYNYISNDLDTVGTLQGKAKAVLLFSSPNSYEVYAAGSLTGGVMSYNQYGSTWGYPSNILTSPYNTLLYSGSGGCLLGPHQ